MTADLARREEAGDYLAVIEGVREMVTLNPATVKDPWVKGWIGRRWRDLFMQEAVKDNKAVDYASKPLPLSGLPLPKLLKKSKPRQAIAERFLKDAPLSEWQAELPVHGRGTAEFARRQQRHATHPEAVATADRDEHPTSPWPTPITGMSPTRRSRLRCARPHRIWSTGGRATPHWWPTGNCSRNWA